MIQSKTIGMILVTLLAVSGLAQTQDTKSASPTKKAAKTKPSSTEATGDSAGSAPSPGKSRAVSSEPVLQNLGYWQPLGGDYAAIPGFGYIYSKDGNLELNYAALSGSFFYGLTDNLAFGGNLTYVSGTITGGFKQNGLADPSIYFRGLQGTRSFNLMYGGTLSVSPGASTVNGLETNSYSGGHAIAPYLGIQTKSKSLVAALVAQYRVRFERTTKNERTSAEVKTTGGNSLTVNLILEIPFESWQPGFQFTYSGTEKSTTGTIESSSSTAWATGLYGTFFLNPDVALIPEIAVSKNPDVTPYVFAGTISGRFTF